MQMHMHAFIDLSIYLFNMYMYVEICTQMYV